MGHPGANSANEPFNLWNNYVRKPRDAVRNWKSAPQEFEYRRSLHAAAKKINDDGMQQNQCGTECEDTTACDLYRAAEQKLATVGRHLNSVEDPEGKRERATNVIRQRNRRDLHNLDQVFLGQKQARRSLKSPSNLSVSTASQSAPSYRAPQQDWSPQNGYQQGWIYEERKEMYVAAYDSGSEDEGYY